MKWLILVVAFICLGSLTGVGESAEALLEREPAAALS